MHKARLKPKHTFVRATLVYLSAIITIALVLFFFGLRSISSYQQEAAGLAVSNLRLWADRLALEMERRSWQSAEAVLRESRLSDHPDLAIPELEKSNEHSEIRELLQGLREAHPIASRFFAIGASTPSADRPGTVPIRLARRVWVEGGDDLTENLRRELQTEFRDPRALRPGQVYSDALSIGDRYHQVFYVVSPQEGNRMILVGFTADQEWVRESLLAQCRRELGMESGMAAPNLVEIRERAFPESDRTDPEETRFDEWLEATHFSLPFKILYPFWELVIVRESLEAIAMTAQTQIMLSAISTLLLLAALVMGIVLLFRSYREIKLGQLRAEFVSAVSHELRTPLTVIRLYAETLLNQRQVTPDTRRSYYQIITEESERLTNLIDNILEVSRIERGIKQYNLTEGNLLPVIARTVNAYKDYLARRGFSFEIQLPESVPCVRFDSGAVARAVLNLIDNARKYSADQKFVAMRLWSEGKQVVFEVEDHGVGIPAAERDQVFEQFYRVRGNSDEKGGYGLGLFLVRDIMAAHGGSIEVESEVNRGSRFRLAFPACVTATETRRVEPTMPMEQTA